MNEALRRWGKSRSGRQTADDPDACFIFIERLSNITNVDGRPRQLSNGDADYIDYCGRPWAQNWEKYFEKGWDKPAGEGAGSDVLDCSSNRKISFLER